MCPLLCVQCECLALDHTNFVFFIIDLTANQDAYDFFWKKINIKKLSEILRRGPSGPKKPQSDIEKYPIGRNTL